eukprot:791441-Pelagomonas_calceolata.AAC.5
MAHICIVRGHAKGGHRHDQTMLMTMEAQPLEYNTVLHTTVRYVGQFPFKNNTGTQCPRHHPHPATEGISSSLGNETVAWEYKPEA